MNLLRPFDYFLKKLHERYEDRRKKEARKNNAALAKAILWHKWLQENQSPEEPRKEEEELETKAMLRWIYGPVAMISGLGGFLLARQVIPAAFPHLSEVGIIISSLAFVLCAATLLFQLLGRGDSGLGRQVHQWAMSISLLSICVLTPVAAYLRTLIKEAQLGVDVGSRAQWPIILAVLLYSVLLDVVCGISFTSWWVAVEYCRKLKRRRRVKEEEWRRKLDLVRSKEEVIDKAEKCRLLDNGVPIAQLLRKRRRTNSQQTTEPGVSLLVSLFPRELPEPRGRSVNSRNGRRRNNPHAKKHLGSRNTSWN